MDANTPILTTEELEALKASGLPTEELEAAAMRNAEEFAAEMESSANE